MTEDTTILPFRQSGKIDDPLTEIAREGARRMLGDAEFCGKVCDGGVAVGHGGLLKIQRIRL